MRQVLSVCSRIRRGRKPGKAGIFFLSLSLLISAVSPFALGSVEFQSVSADSGSLYSQARYSYLDVETFTLPPHLGEVRFHHKGI
jgi:hypothetical protein